MRFVHFFWAYCDQVRQWFEEAIVADGESVYVVGVMCGVHQRPCNDNMRAVT